MLLPYFLLGMKWHIWLHLVEVISSISNSKLAKNFLSQSSPHKFTVRVGYTLCAIAGQLTISIDDCNWESCLRNFKNSKKN